MRPSGPRSRVRLAIVLAGAWVGVAADRAGSRHGPRGWRTVTRNRALDSLSASTKLCHATVGRTSDVLTWAWDRASKFHVWPAPGRSTTLDVCPACSAASDR